MELLEALSNWSVAVALRQPGAAWLLINAAHILSLALLVGAIITLDLRLLGLFGAHPVGELAPPLARVAAVGLVCALISGFFLFVVQPVEYVRNEAFLIKLGLVAFGIANALFVYFLPFWRRALAGEGVHLVLKLLALLSLSTWAAAVVAGRWIGFL